jgi:hypothetical protein
LSGLNHKYNNTPPSEIRTPIKKETTTSLSQLQMQNAGIILSTPASDRGSLPTLFSLFFSMLVIPQTFAYQFPMSNQKTLFLFLA